MEFMMLWETKSRAFSKMTVGSYAMQVTELVFIFHHTLHAYRVCITPCVQAFVFDSDIRARGYLVERKPPAGADRERRREPMVSGRTGGRPSVTIGVSTEV
uniref:(northern house mosquito) hypothetical protein n=1 Tax=Culex pipiens TaxID=7175 RepID=A0A8D8EAP2_CULPI